MIANTAPMDIKPGSMGKPLPGVEAGIVSHEDGEVRVLPDGAIGELALRPGWPSMMRAYLGQPERYAKCFAGVVSDRRSGDAGFRRLLLVRRPC